MDDPAWIDKSTTAVQIVPMSLKPVVDAGPRAQTSSIETLELEAVIEIQFEDGVLLYFKKPPIDPGF